MSAKGAITMVLATEYVGAFDKDAATPAAERTGRIGRNVSDWILCVADNICESNARIAELERSVTVRDTEIARLETDLELARRDAERYRWIRDSDNEGPISAGNATAFGEYGFERVEWFYDDELDAAVDEARAGNWG